MRSNEDDAESTWAVTSDRLCPRREASGSCPTTRFAVVALACGQIVSFCTYISPQGSHERPVVTPDP